MNAARRDLLDLETLPTAEMTRLLEGARAFQRVLASPGRKRPVLAGTAVANVFFEASTRTRVSFECGGAPRRRRGRVVHRHRLVGRQGRDAARHGVDARVDGAATWS